MPRVRCMSASLSLHSAINVAAAFVILHLLNHSPALCNQIFPQINSKSSSLLKKKMSCCGGNCGCGSSCGCGNGCSGCKMYPNLSYTEATAPTVTVVLGVAPQAHFGVAESVEGGSENGCKCGDNCACNPCNCK